jgi:glycosyltransferase involved in cell wall biosynthesis
MHALGVCEGFCENGWDVTIIGGESLNQFAKDMPDSVKCVELTEPKGSFRYIKWWIRLYKVIKINAANDCSTLLILRYAVLANPFLGAIATLLPKKIKKVLEVNSFAYHMIGKSYKPISSFVSFLESIVINRFDALYLVSNAMLTDKRTKRFSVPKFVIPNGATTKEIWTEQELYKKRINEIRLVYLGTLMPYWDFDFLAKVINQLHKRFDIKVAFYGDGPMIPELFSLLKRKDLVEFGGRFDRNDVGKLLKREKDVLLLPPKTKEDMILTGGLSTKMFDYLAMELPILAPSDGEIPSVLKHKNNCLLYNTKDPGDFAVQVNRLLKSKVLCMELAYQAHQDFLQSYSWKARMLSLIDGLTKESVI